MNFKNWLEMSVLRDILKPVPQNPKWHPEGDVFAHTMMVRKALPMAIQFMKAAIQPNTPFAKLNPDYPPEEMNLLRAGAWMHDIGKAGATKYTRDPRSMQNPFGGDKVHWEKLSKGGKLSAADMMRPDWKPPFWYGGQSQKGWQAISHEDPSYFEPEMAKLGSNWKDMYAKMSPQDQADLWFMIKHHMSLRPNFGKDIIDDLIDDQGFYKPDRKVKLLLTLIVMDRIGRGSGMPEDGKAAIDEMIRSANEKVAGIRAHQERQAASAIPNDAQGIIQTMRDRGKPDRVIQQALVGKLKISPEEAEKLLS